jgi:hypothetical protein
MHLPPHRELPARRPLLLRVLVLAGLAAGAVALALTFPPLEQKLAYHQFADQRTLLGIPHCFNVVSNLPFLVVGVLGLRFVLSREAVRPGGPFRQPAERWPYLLFFLGVGLSAFGSAYYHLAPTNDRLLWDRLPMAVAFMSLFAAVLGERVGVKFGLGLLPVLVAAGLASVLYWHTTEVRGQGDLRFYYLVQFYPMLAMPLLLLFFPPRYTRTVDLVAALGWYVLAKVCEHPLDGPIYGLGHWVSGHTLKHLAAAAAAYWVLRMVRERVPTPAPLPNGEPVLEPVKEGP